MQDQTMNTCSIAYQCGLSLDQEVTNHRKTQLVCTIGPACSKPEILIQMIQSGMRVARLNFSHGTHDFHRGLIKAVREAATATGEKIAIALDTKGPEIRTGRTIEDKSISIKRSQSVVVTADDAHKDSCSSEKLYVDYKFLARDVKPGQIILVADGSCVLQVKEIMSSSDVKCESLSASSFGSKKNVCLPGVDVDLPALAPKDIEDIKFGIVEGVDIIFASFIRNKENVAELRTVLDSSEAGKRIKIISKIENQEGVNKIDEIIHSSDGIMVARGDLGMNVALEKMTSIQKMMIARCNCACKPVICATQMMESMIQNERPTRAEVTDVHNAVLDGADAVMLSGETANGQNPPAVIDIMGKICQHAEASICRPSLHENLRRCNQSKCRRVSTSPCCYKKKEAIYFSLAISASDLALSICASAIICLTETGEISRFVSSARPHCPILMVSRDAQTARQAYLYSGVIPIHFTGPDLTAGGDCSKWCEDMRQRVDHAVKYGIEKGIITAACPRAVLLTSCKSGSGNHSGLRIIDVDMAAKKAFGH